MKIHIVQIEELIALAVAIAVALAALAGLAFALGWVLTALAVC